MGFLIVFLGGGLGVESGDHWNILSVGPSVVSSRSFHGNGDLVINNDTSLTSLPLPKAVMVQTGGRPILTQ